MRQGSTIGSQLDWVTILIYLFIVLLGWLNIYAAVYDEKISQNIFDLSINAGKQFLFIVTALVITFAIMIIDFKFFDTFGYFIYGAVILLLVLVLVFGKEVAGSKSWFDLGFFRLQPAEFAKFATALAIAKFMGEESVRMDRLSNQLKASLILGIPVVLILLQGDTGTALVFTIFLIVFYREGMSPLVILLGMAAFSIFILTLLVENHWYLYMGIIGIAVFMILMNRKRLKRIFLIIFFGGVIFGVIESVDYIITDVLKPHQQNRIRALINPEADPLGYGWNVTQSKIAIGSGGLQGKGFLNGTQTKGEFVPEQSTDFIFCTIGEEHGWIGSMILITLFVILLLRIVAIAERQKWRFARVYGYALASILFFHFAVNIGMTIGLFPVIGIPLPFFSYGGSSLWSFTIMLMVLIKLDAHRMQVLVR